MPRIRTIKPEFPQSESMGNVSREARLAFILLWTIADDSGRLRGNSRMLASLLFPYDDDAPGLIDDWLDELDHEGCIARFSVDGASYIQVLNWLDHQRIDKPSPSKIPEFQESSRILANDLGRKGKEGKGEEEDQKPTLTSSQKAVRFDLTSAPQEWIDFCRTERPDLNPEKTFAAFRDYWIAIPGAKGRKLDWFATWRNWCRNGKSGPTRPPATRLAEPPRSNVRTI